MSWEVLQGDALATLRTLPSEWVDCCVTSPPYWGLRDYGVDGQMGLEETPEAFAEALVEVLEEVRRILKPHGTLWLNIGDSYCTRANGPAMESSALEGSTAPHAQFRSSHALRSFRRDRAAAGGVKHRAAGDLKHKDLVGIPWRVAFALQAAGWWLRQDIIWHKPNPMPESVRDRCTKSHEYLFLLSKSGKPTRWRARDTMEWSADPDLSETLPDPTEDDPENTMPRWRAFDYYFDAEEIREPLAESTFARVAPHRAQGGKAERSGEVNRAGQPNNTLRLDQAAPANGRNKRSVWTVATTPFKGAHFATMPIKLAELCILAGSAGGGASSGPFLWLGDHRMRGPQAGPRVRGDRAEPGIRLHGAGTDPRVRPAGRAPLQGAGMKMKTYDDWRAAGYQVKRGAISQGRDKEGKALFCRKQVEERRDFDRREGSRDE